MFTIAKIDRQANGSAFVTVSQSNRDIRVFVQTDGTIGKARFTDTCRQLRSNLAEIHQVVQAALQGSFSSEHGV